MANLIFSGIDGGQGFDFGRTSLDYARYRDIYPDSMYRKLERFGIVRPGERILDVGTGTGVLPRNLYAAGMRWTGADFSPEQIAMAKQLSKGLDIAYVVAPAENLPFPEANFDLVTACQCFWYFDIPAFLGELKRILVPRGRFCRIIMNWLPRESELAADTEALILRYNPAWTGRDFHPEAFEVPSWIRGTMELTTFHSYRENLPFSIESWCGRIRACRGIGASLSATDVAAFSSELRHQLESDGFDSFLIPHYIQMEEYRFVG